MKVTNVSSSKIYLADLKFLPQAQTEGRRGEDQYLDPGDFVYLPNTSEVIRSALKGDLKKFRDTGYITLEEVVQLANGGGSITLTHNFGFAPAVVVLKRVVVGPVVTWVDATGVYNLTHNATYTTVTIQNTVPGLGSTDFYIRLLT
jgi:hypothetical protein